MEKVIVIGTNHAGTHVVKTVAENYSDKMKVVTYDQNNNISFLGCGMALWISKVIDNPNGLFYANQQILEAEGIEVHLEHRVESVDFDGKSVVVRNLRTDEVFTDSYDKLVIATGSWPIVPPIEGVELENIVYAKLFQHAEHVIELLKDESIKRVAVVGGGYIGIELAESFHENGREVVLINDCKILNKYYDEDFVDQMTDNLVDNGLNLAVNEKVIKFNGVDGKVSQVVTNEQTYDVDLVLMSVGFRPVTDLFKDTKLELFGNGAIKVNANQQTNIEDVYAVGDCATIHDNSSDQDSHIALASNAVRTGIVAGHNVGGTPIQMQGVQGSNAIHVFGLTMCASGMTELRARELGFDVGVVEVNEWLKPEFMPENEKVKLKLIWDRDSRRILGAQMSSKADITLANHFFSLAIQEKYSIDKLALLDLFFLPHFNQPANFITLAGLKALGK